MGTIAKKNWDRTPEDIKRSVLSEYLTIKWHTLDHCFTRHTYDFYQEQKEMLYRIFGRTALCPYESKVRALATRRYGDYVFAKDGRAGYVVDAVFDGINFCYELSGNNNTGTHSYIREYNLEIPKEMNKLTQWGKYKIGGIINPKEPVEPIPNVRNSFGKITEIYDYKGMIYIVADYSIGDSKFENIFTEMFVKEEKKKEPLARCKYMTKGCKCSLSKNIVYDSTFDADVAYCAAYGVTINFEKCKDYVAESKNQTTPNKNTIQPNGIKTYLMRDDSTGATKIGKSKNPKFRARTLLSDRPTISLKMVCELDVEKILHLHFKHKRTNGEWFDLTQEDIDWICKEYDFKEP